MVSSPNLRELSIHLQPYIEEIQDLLASHGQPFGTPETLGPLAAELAHGAALADEVSAKIRSVLFREGEGLTQAALLELMVAAIAGPEVDLQAPTSQGPVRQLLLFLDAALRTYWKSSPDGPLRSRLAEDAPRTRLRASARMQRTCSEASTRPHVPTVVAAHERRAEVEDTFAQLQPALNRINGCPPNRFIEEVHVWPERNSLSETSAPLCPVANEVRIARPEYPADPSLAAIPIKETIDAGFGDATEAANTDEGIFPQYRALPLFTSRRRTYSVVGAGAVLLASLFAFLPHGRQNAKEGAAAMQATSTLASRATVRKPSPYGLPAITPPNRATSALANTAPSVMELRPPDPLPGADSPLAHARAEPASSRFAGRASAQSPSEGAVASDDSSIPSERDAEPDFRNAQRSSVSAREGIYISATGIMAANLLAAPAPVYPVAASEAGIQGKVIVQALVGRNGRVIDAHVVSGDPMLREAALSAVRGWRYRPYLADGRAAEVETLATLDFRLFQREE